MLSNYSPIADGSQYMQDSMATKPTFSKSVYDNFSAGVATPFVAASELNDYLRGSVDPDTTNAKTMLDMVDQENAIPGIGFAQKSADYVANLAGSLLNPINLIAGEGLGALAGAGVKAGMTILPDAASSFLAKPIADMLPGSVLPAAAKDATLESVTSGAAHAFGAGAGFGIAPGIVDNYNADKNNISWGGVASDMGKMGVFGIALSTIPFAYGVVKGLINRGVGADASTLAGENSNTALEQGHITAAEQDFVHRYENIDPKDEKAMQTLQKDADQIAINRGINVDTVNHKVPYPIIDQGDMENLQGAKLDQLVSGLPEDQKSLVSQFIVNNAIDKKLADQTSIDGLRGYSDDIASKLDAKPEKLAEADGILDANMEKGVTENLDFSQKKIVKLMNQSGIDSSTSHMMPMTVPDNVIANIKKQERIKELTTKNAKAVRNGAEPNVQTLRRIDELKESQPKILTPKEELNYLRDKFTNKELPNDFEMSKDFGRLRDLAQVWPQARLLFDRVMLEHEYNRQEAFKALVDQILNINDAKPTKLSSIDNVVSYLKSRIEGKTQRIISLPDEQQAVKRGLEIPKDADNIISSQRIEADKVAKSGAKDLKDDYVKSSDKYSSFKESQNVFKNLVQCVLGAING